MVLPGDVQGGFAGVGDRIQIRARLDQTRDALRAPRLRGAVRLLLAFGANPNLASDSSWTAVHGAAEAGSAECVASLIEAGANLNPIADSGKTPLDIARQYHGVDAVVTRCLFDLGAAYGLRWDDDDEEDDETKYPPDDEDDASRRGIREGIGDVSETTSSSVSYTHLTLPTIYSV